MFKSINTFFFILILAIVFRLLVLNQSFWLDEAISAHAARDFSYTQIVTDFIKADNHPPLYYMVLKVWGTIFGYSEVALRMLSVLSGVLTIAVLYLILRKISPETKSLNYLTVLFLATSPLHIYYSQEVRMYPLITLLISLSVYLFVGLIKGERVKLNLILFSVTLILMVATDYITVFMLPVFLLYGAFFKKDLRWNIRLWVSYIPLAVVLLFWLPIFRIQTQNSGNLLNVFPNWREVVGGASVKQLVVFWSKFVWGRVSLINKELYIGLTFLFSLPFIVALGNIKKSKITTSVFWLWFLVPLFLGFVFSVFVPAFIYFRFIYVLPAFYFLVAVGILNFKNISVRRILIFGVLIANFTGLGFYNLDISQQREDWRGAVGFVERQLTFSDVVIFENPEPIASYLWYSKRKELAFGATNALSANKENTNQLVDTIISNKTRVVYFNYLRDLTDPGHLVEKRLMEKGYERGETYGNFNGVGEISFWIKNANIKSN